MPNPDVFEAYSVSLLRSGEHYLLLQRDARKSFAPGRWTGVGGHVEAHEFAGLRASGLREVVEETGLNAQAVRQYTLRRALFSIRPGLPMRLILYFTGNLSEMASLECDEGKLAWFRPEEFAALDIIETTRPVVACLIDDMRRDPDGDEAIHPGIAVFSAGGQFQHIVWGL